MEREKIIYIFFYLLKNIRRFERLQYQRKGKSRNGRPTFGAYFLLNKITIFKLEGEFEKLSSSAGSQKKQRDSIKSSTSALLSLLTAQTVCECEVIHLCLTRCDPMECSLPFLSPGDLPYSGNLGLLHCRQMLYHLSHQGSPQTVWITTNCGKFLKR